MESNHNNNDNYGEEQQQQAFENVHLESLSRDDLIKLVHKLLVEKNEAQKTTTQVIAEKTKQIDALLVQLNESTSILTMADSPSTGRNRKLPAELNQQIFYCLNLPTRRKFIYGLGWDFYAMFRHRLLMKTKKVRNPCGNRWDGTKTRATVAADGLNVSNQVAGFANVFAELAFLTSEPHCRVDDFPGSILYYYEVKGQVYNFGLSDCHHFLLGGFYVTPSGGHNYYYECWLDGEYHDFQLPEEAIRPQMKEHGNVYGCGLVLDPDNKLWIFFTLNGILMGRKISISPTMHCLFPAVTMMSILSSIEANFGNDPTKPFEFDITNCPGLELDCIEKK